MVQLRGKFYHEIQLQTCAHLQLGWGTPAFVAKPDMGRGCGDDEEGMSWDTMVLME